MAYNPSPRVAVARDYGERFGYDQVIIIGIVGENITYASSGKTKALCNQAKKFADRIFKAIGVK